MAVLVCIPCLPSRTGRMRIRSRRCKPTLESLEVRALRASISTAPSPQSDVLATVTQVSPTLHSPGEVMPAQEVSTVVPASLQPADDDPLPEPEPSPGPYPGDNPPIDHPELPPSGPVGPGS
jgi:hypothetical protein